MGMRVTMKLVLEGLPERIQEVADTLDRAFPEAIDWAVVAELGRGHTMRLEGVTLLHGKAQPTPDLRLFSDTAQALRLSSSDAWDGDRLGVLLCSSFQP